MENSWGTFTLFAVVGNLSEQEYLPQRDSGQMTPTVCIQLLRARPWEPNPEGKWASQRGETYPLQGLSRTVCCSLPRLTLSTTNVQHMKQEKKFHLFLPFHNATCGSYLHVLSNHSKKLISQSLIVNHIKLVVSSYPVFNYSQDKREAILERSGLLELSTIICTQPQCNREQF